MLPWRREGGKVFAFGNPWRPERMLDEHVHFRAGQCVHDRHMNQVHFRGHSFATQCATIGDRSAVSG